jgi:hypothetical protein
MQQRLSAVLLRDVLVHRIEVLWLASGWSDIVGRLEMQDRR